MLFRSYLETMLRIYLYRVAGTSTEANEITANDRNTINALVANKLPRAPQMYVDIE